MRSGFAEFRQFIMKDPMEVILPLGIFAAPLLVCWVARRLVLRALKAWTARTASRMGTVLHRALTRPPEERAREALGSLAEYADAERLIPAGLLEDDHGVLRLTPRAEATFRAPPDRRQLS